MRSKCFAACVSLTTPHRLAGLARPMAKRALNIEFLAAERIRPFHGWGEAKGNPAYPPPETPSPPPVDHPQL